MKLTVADIMNSSPHTTTPEMSLVDLELFFVEKKISGAPVLENGELVGIVSRSDIVQKLNTEQTFAEVACDFYSDPYELDPSGDKTACDIGEAVGRRLQGLHVRDLMSTNLITIRPDQTLKELAQTMVKHRIHRILVTEGSKLVGFVSTIDMVQLFIDEKI